MSIFNCPVFYISGNGIFMTEYLVPVVCGIYCGFLLIGLFSKIIATFVPKLFHFIKNKFKGGKK